MLAAATVAMAQDASTNSPPATPVPASAPAASAPVTNVPPAATNAASAAPTTAPATNAVSPATEEVSPAPAPAPAKPTAAERNIRFQFDGMSYSEVLERFAQMAHKPLLTETKVEGTLTYNDPKPYTYPEAFDTLNLMLSMKGLMLVETDHYLRLVPFKELPQMPLKILHGLEHDGDVRPGEVVTVVLSLKNLEAGEVSQSITPMLSSAGSVAPLSRGQGLILTDHLANIQRIRYLLDQIDTESAVTRQMKTYTLVHASGAIVADLINKTFGASTAPKRTRHNPKNSSLDVLPPDPADYVTSIYDEASRTMVLWGPTDRVTLAEELINKFEQQGGLGGDIRIYYPQDLKLEELAQMIRQAIPGVAAPNENAPTKARLIPDASQDRLIVVAPIPGQLESIDSFINQVDKGVKSTGNNPGRIRSETIQVTKVFRPRTAEPATVAKILTEALTRRLPSGATATSANVSVEPGSQSVVVSGSPSDVQTAISVLAQLEDGTVPTEALQTKFFEVGSAAEAKRLETLVQQLYRNQVGEPANKLPSAAKIVAEPDSGRLIVTATPEHLTLIEKLLKDLQSEPTATQPRNLEILTLDHTQVNDVIKNLTSLVTERMSEKRFQDLPKPVITPDAANNRLLVTATAEQLKEIKSVLQILDLEPALVPRQTRIFKLENLRADTGLASFNNLLNERLTDKRFVNQPKPTITPDVPNNRLLVTASADQLKEIEEVLQLLDVAPELAKRDLHVVTLKHLRVDTGLTSINNLVNERMADKRFDRVPKPTLVPDAPNNRLVITATDEQFQEIEQVINLLDVVPETAKREMRVIAIQSKSAGEIISLTTQLMTQLVEAQPNPQLAPKLIPDPSGRQIIALATPSDLQRLETFIQQLDTAAATSAARQFKAVELFSRNATELTPLVQQLYQEQLKGLAEPAGGAATLLADTKNNRIMVSGSEAEIARAEALIRQLDPESLKGTKEETRVVRLKSALAAELAALVEKSLNAQSQQIKVLVDARSNSLVLTGDSAAVEAASKVIDQLDTRSDMTPREIRIMDLRSGDATTVAPMVTSLFTEMIKDKRGPEYVAQAKIVADTSANRLIVTGPKPELEMVEELVKQLDETPGQSSGARVFKLNSADAGVLAPIVSNAMMRFDVRGQPIRKVTVSADPKSNSLIVTGSRTDLQDAAVIIEGLDGDSGGFLASDQTRQLKVIKVNTDDPAQLAQLALQVFTAQNLGRNLTNVLTITPEPVGKRLIVMAPATLMPQVETVIKTLDLPTEQEPRGLHPVDLKNARAQELMTSVNRIYAEQTQGKPGKPATIYPDTAGKRLMVFGTQEQAAAIQQIVEALESQAKTPRETKVFDFGLPTEAQRLMPLIQQLYKDQLANDPTAGPADAQLITDPRSGRVIVSARTDDLKRIEDIVATLQPITDTNLLTRETKVFDLGRLAEAQRVLPLVQQLYRDRLTNDPAAGAPDAQMISDGRTGRIIVSARQDQLQLIENILTDLKPMTDTNQVTRATRSFEVGTPANVERLLPLVQKLYTDQWKDRSEEDPADAQIMGDPRAGRIIATGKTNHLKQIEAILQQLGVNVSGDSNAPPSKLKTAERETRIFDLTSANAVELATTVRTLYLDQVKSRLGSLQPDTLIVPDVNANRLIVVAEPIELAAVEDIVQKLDKVSAQSASARVFKLKSADPTKVSEILQSALVTYDSYGRPRKRVTISVDAATRTIIATGDAKELQAASVIIEQLDSSLGTQTDRQMKVVSLKNVRASELYTKVQQLYQDQVKSRPELGIADALVMPDATSNQLILAGSTAQLELIEKIINDLQAAQANQAPRETKMIDIGPADEVTRLLPLVQQLYREQWRDQDPSDPPDAQIIPDTKNGRFIVTARTNHIAAIEDIVKKVQGDRTATADLRETRVYDLTSATAIELATTVRSLYLEQAKARPGSAASDTIIQPDPGANRLIVCGTTNELAIVEDIITKLDKVSAQSASARVFKLKSADPTKVSEILQSALVTYDSYGRPRKRVTISVDANTRTIIATGDAKELQAASVIIEQLDSSLGTQTDRQMKVVSLKNVRASELYTKVQQLYQDQVKSRPELGIADALVMPDATSNQLILAGSSAQLDLIEKIINDLQAAQANQAPRETKMIDIGPADEVTRLLPLVQQLYQEQWRDQAPSDPADAQIMPDTKNGRFIITARTNHIAAIEDIVKKVQGDRAATAELRETRVYDLTAATAVELAATVRSLYLEQAKARPGSTASETIIQPDPGANRLVVCATTNELAMVEDIITKLDKVSTQSASARVFKLKSADPTKVSEILQSALVTYDSYGRPRKRVTISVDAATRTIIATGDAKELQAASVIIEQLDSSLGVQAERQMKVVPLKKAHATELVSQVQQLYQDRVKSNPELGLADALILPDATSNQLILAGTEPQVKVIEDIVSQLVEHAAAQGPRETKFFEIGQPEEVRRVQALVQQLYTDEWKDKQPQDPADAQILPDEQNGRLIVTARQEHLAAIEKIITQIHPERAEAAAIETKVYDLQATSAAELATTVKTLYQEQLKSRPSAPVSQATILPDLTANRLIVSATTNELAALDAIIKKLDDVSLQSGRTRVFKLKSAEAEQVASVLSTAFTEMSRYGRPLPRVSVGADRQNNLLIVSGEPKDLQAVATIIEEMDSAITRGKRSMRIFALKTGLATEVSSRVEQLYKDQVKGSAEGGTADALIMGDDVSNRLIVTASDAHMKVIESIVTQLQEAGEGTGRQTRVLMLERNSASSIAAMMSQLFWRETRSTDPGQRLVITASPDDRTLLVDATGQILEKVEQLVKTLDSDEAKGALEVRTYQIPDGNAMLLAQGLSRMFMERGGGAGGPAPRFEGDPTSNILLVGATKDQFTKIDKLIEELKASVSVTNEIRTFVLKNGDPEQVSQVLEDMLSDGGSSRGSGGYRGPGSYMYRMRSRGGASLNEVRVTPATSLNAVVVQGPPEKLVIAEQLVKTLDSEEGPGKWEVRTYEAPEGTAFNLAQSLQRLFAERGERPRRGMEPRFEADAGGSVLMVGATKDQFEQIDKLITELKTSVSVTNEMRTFVLKNGDPEQIANVLEEMLTGASGSSRRFGNPGRPGNYRYGRSGSSSSEVRIAPAPSLNAIVVQGPPDKLALAEQLVQSLDSEEGPGKWEVRTYQAPEGSAVTLSQSLQRLFTERRGPNTVGLQPRFEADANADVIMVGATKDQFEQISKLITELQSSISVTNEMRTFVLKNADPEQVASVLEEMLAGGAGGSRRGGGGRAYGDANGSPFRYGRSRATGPSNVQVAAAPSLKAVVVQGPPDKLVLAEQLVRSLDSEEGPGKWEVRTYPAPEGSAMNLAQSLQRLFTERGGPTRTGLEPRFEADMNSNVIMVGATKDQFTQIDKLVEEVLKSAAPTSEIRTFILKFAEPEQISNVLSDMLSGTGGSSRSTTYYPGASYRYARMGGAATREVHVSPAPALNAVVVQGPPDKIVEAEKLIATLDKEDAEGQNVIQAVHLAKGRAEDIAEALSQNIADRTSRMQGAPKTRMQRVNVTAVGGADSLLISGPGDAVKEVLSIIRELDQESKGDEIEVRIYKLENGEAKEISTVIQQLLLNVTRATPRSKSLARNVPASVSVDEKSNSLIISGTAAHFSVVEKVLPTLDRIPERADRDIDIVWLQNAQAMDVAFTLNSAFEARDEKDRPVIESDIMANTITIIGKKADIAHIQDMIARMDEPSNDNSVQVRLRAITSVPAEQMIKMLTNIYPQMVFGQIRVVDKLKPQPMKPEAARKPAGTNQPPGAPALPTSPTNRRRCRRKWSSRSTKKPTR